MGTKHYKTSQEEFWAGDFGDEYVERITGDEWVASNIALFSRIFRTTERFDTLLELGANIGLNLRSLKTLFPSLTMDAVEINSQAAAALKQIDGIGTVYNDSILDVSLDKQYEVVLIKGVLIHINPDELNRVYEKIYNSTSRYIVLAEYYNPTPVEVPYRGHEGKLFKRDFAGEMLDRYPDLSVVDYGFVWHRDVHFPQDDCTWFVLSK